MSCRDPWGFYTGNDVVPRDPWGCQEGNDRVPGAILSPAIDPKLLRGSPIIRVSVFFKKKKAS